MKFARLALFVSAFIFGILSSALADPQLEVRLNPAESVTEGETGELLIQIGWKSQEAGYRFSEPYIKTENLSVEPAGESNEIIEKNGQSWNWKQYRFNLKALKPGKGEILPFGIHYVDPTTQKTGFLESPALQIRIAPNYGKLLKPILWGTGFFAFLAGLFFAFARFKKRGAAEVPKPPTTEESFLRTLQAGQSLRDLERGLKSYLQAKYGLPRKVSPQELFEGLREKLSHEDLETLGKIFDKLERFSFAEEATSAESSALINEIMQFIEGRKIIHQEDPWTQPSKR